MKILSILSFRGAKGDEESAFLRRAVHAFLLATVVTVFMGAGDPDARFRDLGNRMICTCGCGQLLLKCNHLGCQSLEQMTGKLQAALAKGDNDDLILQGFVQDYGPTVIAAPTGSGFNVVAWIMPFIVLALGVTLIIWIIRLWKNRPAPALADGITIPRAGELDALREQARKETEL